MARLPILILAATAALLTPGCVADDARRPLPACPTERAAIWEGRRVVYDDVPGDGDGTGALVFVHGWACDARVWRGQLRAFRSLGRVIAVDLPGHGRSEVPSDGGGSLTFTDLAGAVMAVMDDAGVERAVVVGHSNGAPVARLVARGDPARVVGLVLLDGALRVMVDDPALQQRFADAFSGPEGVDRAVAMTRGTLGEDRSPEQLADLLAMVAAVPQPVMLSTLRAAWDPAGYPAEPVTTPTLMIMVDQPSWDDDYRAWVAALVPDLDWQLVQGVSHFVQVDAPEDVNRRVAGFVGRRGLLGPAPERHPDAP